MSSSNPERYYSSLSKSRRSSPGESPSAFFQTGQGGRTVLPPLSSAFPTSRFPVPGYPNHYTQPRSSPGRYDYNQQALYNQWPSTTSPQPASSYPYETHDRYSTQHHYSTYPSRSSPVPGNQLDSRKLPPLATNSGAGWQTAPSYVTAPSNYTTSGGIRSPTASYPTSYAGYPTSNQLGAAYTYHMPSEELSHPHVPSMGSQAHIPAYEITDTSRSDHHRSSSPYSRGSSHVSPPTYTPPPISPTSQDESAIKKKRKRADAAQLKVLNETYNRTPFPSTEERLGLAKKLGMSARSVQIWFQNKRQSMRQTNRQSSSIGSSSQPYGISGQEAILEELEHPSMYSSTMPMTDAPYPSKHAQDVARSQSPSSHRRVRAHEDMVDPRKWSHGY